MQQARAEQARRESDFLSQHLVDYIPAAWPVVEPVTSYLSNWHIGAMAEKLEAVTNHEIQRLIINIPPRYMKSNTVAVFWPTWSWAREPNSRWIFASYAAGLSTKHSVDRRTILQSDWYRARWGSTVQMSGDQNVKTEFQNTARGVMVSTSMTGTVTGKGGDVIVIDDPLNPSEAWSDIERERANRDFDQTFSSRLNDKRTGAIVVVMQRLHEGDLTGHLLDRGGWEHLCIPAEYEPQHPFVWPLDPRKEAGQLLWPDREGPKEIEFARAQMGPYGYAGQYQQHPTPIEGGILKRGWWKYYDPANLELWTLPPLMRLVTSWDTAMKDKATNDFCVGTVWGAIGANRYLLRRVRDRMGLPETKTQVSQLAAWVEQHFPHLPHSIVVENAANGPDVVAQLRDVVGGLVLNKAEGDKVQRAHAVSGVLESGNVYVPGYALADGTGYDPARTPAWVQELIDECAAFNNGLHDDQVDSVTQALLRLKGEFNERAFTEERQQPSPIKAVIDRQF